ncbi:MAG: hypothetical protein HUU37_06950 [Bdellovibrionales bacterium]|nr:hypothetical protein [Bdellovibrionales bacterium]
MSRWQEHRPEEEPEDPSWAPEDEDVQNGKKRNISLNHLTNSWKWEGAYEWNF